VSLKWVFNVKYNTSRSLNKLKARLVTRGFLQIHGIDFNETFALTVRYNTLRLFFTVVVINNKECY